MAAILIRSRYQTQLSFTTEQTGIDFTFNGIVFRKEPQAVGNLRAVKSSKVCIELVGSESD